MMFHRACLLLLAGCVNIASSKIIINEIMIGPNDATDPNTNWVELYNTENTTVALNGWQMRTCVNNPICGRSNRKTFVTTASIGPFGYVIVGNNNNTATNGGIQVDVLFPTLGPWPASGTGQQELVLFDPFDILNDRFYWSTDRSTFFYLNYSFVVAASLARLTANGDSRDVSNWKPSTIPMSCNTPLGDKGTPGKTNAFACPTKAPTKTPTNAPTRAPSKAPTKKPTNVPTKAPTKNPTTAPTKKPTKAPTRASTRAPIEAPITRAPVVDPLVADVPVMVAVPMASPVASSPTKQPTKALTNGPTNKPTKSPTKNPTTALTSTPTRPRLKSPTKTKAPSKAPATRAPVVAPVVADAPVMATVPKASPIASPVVASPMPPPPVTGTASSCTAKCSFLGGLILGIRVHRMSRLRTSMCLENCLFFRGKQRVQSGVFRKWQCGPCPRV